MTKRYKSDVLRSVHLAAEDAFHAGVMDKKTMRRFDASCLTSIKTLKPEDIYALRQREGVSQNVFARYLNVARKLIGEWERGEKTPSGPSLKLLCLVKEKGLEAIA